MALLKQKGSVTLAKFQLNFVGKKGPLLIVNSVTMSEAQLTQTLNQAAFCWSTVGQATGKSVWGNLSPFRTLNLTSL